MLELPSSRDPLHPFIFVFELITVTFTSPLHLINSWELFLGRCNRGRGARYWAVCVSWLIQVASCLGFGRRLALLFWSGGGRTLNCRFCPHDGDIMGVARGCGV